MGFNGTIITAKLETTKQTKVQEDERETNIPSVTDDASSFSPYISSDTKMYKFVKT